LNLFRISCFVFRIFRFCLCLTRQRHASAGKARCPLPFRATPCTTVRATCRALRPDGLVLYQKQAGSSIKFKQFYEKYIYAPKSLFSNDLHTGSLVIFICYRACVAYLPHLTSSGCKSRTMGSAGLRRTFIL
jgi:hypothetical protein